MMQFSIWMNFFFGSFKKPNSWKQYIVVSVGQVVECEIQSLKSDSNEIMNEIVYSLTTQSGWIGQFVCNACLVFSRNKFFRFFFWWIAIEIGVCDLIMCDVCALLETTISKTIYGV